MTDKTLITGTGRSGTGWCAKVLNGAGVKCGHQSVFKHEHTLTGVMPSWDGWDADSSYEAVPLLPKLYPNVYVILVIRHPLAVMRSWLEHGAFTDDMPSRFGQFWQVLQKHHPGVMAEKQPVDRVGRYWLEWNASAARHAKAIAPIEELTPRLLCHLIGVITTQTALSPVDAAVADKTRQVGELGWRDVKQPLRGHLRAYAEQWGYK